MLKSHTLIIDVLISLCISINFALYVLSCVTRRVHTYLPGELTLLGNDSKNTF